MSKFEDGSYGSLPGIALLGKVLAGRCEMKYTRAAAGSGAIPDGMTPKTMTGCAGYVMDARIANISNPVDGECQVTIQIKSDDVEHGFYATNIVLFAEDPDEGEVPYTYLSLENEPEWIRPASSIVGKLATFDLIAAVGDVDVVKGTIDPEAIATVSYVEQAVADHSVDPAAHPDLWAALASVPGMEELTITIPRMGWTASGKAEYPYTVDVADKAVHHFHVPQAALAVDDVFGAAACGLCPTVQAVDGALRFWAATVPAADMTASVLLIRPGGNGGIGGGIGGTLPLATADTPGAVKPGDGLAIAPDGTLSVDRETVLTGDDLVDENEVAESVANILNGDAAK